MKVLMFGWEFPPHISGGLGTACFGLTNALLKEEVKILFVVPRLFGDEPDGDSFLVNASRVHRLRVDDTDTRKKTTKKKIVYRRRRRMRRVRHVPVQRAELTFLEVPSFLTPYHTPNRTTGMAVKTGLTTASVRTVTETTETTILRKVDSEERIGEQPTERSTEQSEVVFRFSGTYGKDLLEEVSRYAEVAEILATKYTFDVIHVHDWMTFPAGIAAKRKSGRPLIVHVHSTEFDRSGSIVNPHVFEIEQAGFMEADRIIAVSNWTKSIVVSRYNIPEEKVVVVHNGVLPKQQHDDFVFPSVGSHFVTFLGRITQQKGPWYFVEAAYKVLQEFPEAHFIVAGAGDLLPQIIERVAQLSMSSHFHFTGFLSGNQVDHIWALTDVYVMPSVSEPFGIAPLEAIQGDVPVVISKQSGVAEVMPHAIKVDFWDTSALASAICSVLRYESLSNVLRLKSKEHLKHLSWDKAAREVKSLYYELVAKE